MNSKHFEVHFHPSDESFAQTLTAKADSLYEKLTEQFGFIPAESGKKILLTICGNLPEYLATTGKNAEEYREWMVGCSDFQNKAITILSPRISTTHTAEELVQVFVHETVHIILDTQAGNEDAPLWCAEGIAVLCAEQLEMSCIDTLNFPKINELLDENAFSALGGYDYSAVYVRYFIERYGFSTFWTLYCNAQNVSELIYEGFEKDAILKQQLLQGEIDK